MNKLFATGNLTADPVSHTTSDGREVCNFTVAVNRRKKVPGQPDADFFRIAVWGNKAGPCQQYLKKGSKVTAIGPVSVSTYQAQDGTTRANMEVFAEEVEFLGGGGNASQGDTAPADQTGYTPVETDQLPF